MASKQGIQVSQAWEWAREVGGGIGGLVSHSAFANVVALAALIISLWALRKSAPRLKVELGGGVIVDSKVPRWNGNPAAFVTVTNHGLAPAYIQSVYLTSRLGSLPAHYVDSHKHEVQEERSGPVEIAPNGGSERWLVNRFEMRDFAARDAGDTEVKFRALVKSGGKKLRSRTVELVHPNEPHQVPKRKLPLKERAKSLFKNLFIPWPIPTSASGWGSRIEDIDLENNRYRIRVKNLGGGVVRGAVLELHASSPLGTYRKERVGEPIPLPYLWRKQERLIWVPFAEEENQTWMIRFRGRISTQGVGATTREQVESGIAKMNAQEQKAGENPDKPNLF